jgi:hypothetical protein
MATSSLAELLQPRFSSIEQMPQKENPRTDISSIEQPPSKDRVQQGEIPDAIDQLIGNKMYRNRYKKLIREGHLETLLYLANYAKTVSKVEKPAQWFGKCCSLAKWEGTLRWTRKMMDIAKKAMQAARTLGTEVTRFIYQQIHKGVNVEHAAALAKENGREPYKLFTYLCRNGLTPVRK